MVYVIYIQKIPCQIDNIKSKKMIKNFMNFQYFVFIIRLYFQIMRHENELDVTSMLHFIYACTIINGGFIRKKR